MKYVFTFGSDSPLDGRYIEVEGDFNTARAKVADMFGSVLVFQYNESEWNQYKNMAMRKNYPCESYCDIDEAKRIVGISHVR